VAAVVPHVFHEWSDEDFRKCCGAMVVQNLRRLSPGNKKARKR
jgi:hypothetical protein